MNLGSRYQPKNYRRPSRKRRIRRPSKKQKKRRPTKKQKKRRPTKKQTKRRPSKRKSKSRPIRKEKKRRLKVSDIMFEIHRSLMSKPDPEIIPTVENREFFQGLFKLFYSKSLFFLLLNLNLGIRYDPSDYRRLSYQPRHYRSLRYQPSFYRGLSGNNLGKN